MRISDWSSDVCSSDLRCRARAALEHELPAHELAVIFADRAFGRAEAGIGAIGAAGPFPDVAEKAGRVAKARRERPGGVELIAACRIVLQRRRLPFGLDRKSTRMNPSH